MSKRYKIEIIVSDVGGIYSADNIDEAMEIAQRKCDDIYTRLDGRCSVEIENVEEVV